MIHEIRKRILLVDDDSIIALCEKQELENYGYSVQTAISGEKAVAAIKASAGIDLVLMDIDLGTGMDGTQAAELILQDHDIPILFVSSHSERSVVEKTEKITSYGYVVKGSSIAVLDASIKMAFKLFYSHKKISESEANYRNLADNIPDIIYSLDGEGKIKTINSASFMRYGYNQEASIGKAFIDFVHPDDREILIASFLSALRDKRTQTMGLTFRIIAGDGLIYWFELNAHAHFDKQGTYCGEEGLLRDISERKKIEESMRVSKETTELLLNVAAEIIISEDFDGNILLLNDSGHRILGYEPPELIGRNYIDLCVPDELKKDIRNYYACRKNGGTGSIDSHENEVVTKTGERKTILWNNIVFDDKNKRSIGAFSSGLDITERKRSENLLLKEKEKLQIFLSGTNTGIWEWNIQTGENIVDESSARILGYTLDELQPVNMETWIRLKHPDDAINANKLLMKHVSGETAFYYFESRMKHKNGSWVWVQGRGKITEWDKEGRPLRMFGTHIDVTERKKTEEALKESESKYRQLYESIMDAIVLIDMDGRILYSNAVFQKMLGYSMNELRAFSYQDLTTAKSFKHETDSYTKQILGRGYSDIYEKEYIRKDGSVCAVEIRAFLLKSRENKPSSVWAIVRDISDRKLAEARIQSLLTEKELILKEVHHRIKNNMTTIVSLLSLHAQTVKEPSAASALEDAKNRVQSTMVLYDKLYQSAGFSNVSVQDYLPALIDEIVSGFPNGRAVKVEKRIDDFVLDAKRQQPLGIIINELITNIMKYAFADKDGGIITVSASNTGGRIAISVRDNGKGMPESLTFENSTGFGLMLVQVLTEQLDGTIRIERGNGTAFILEFQN